MFGHLSWQHLWVPSLCRAHRNHAHLLHRFTLLAEQNAGAPARKVSFQRKQKSHLFLQKSSWKKIAQWGGKSPKYKSRGKAQAPLIRPGERNFVLSLRVAIWQDGFLIQFFPITPFSPSVRPSPLPLSPQGPGPSGPSPESGSPPRGFQARAATGEVAIPAGTTEATTEARFLSLWRSNKKRQATPDGPSLILCQFQPLSQGSPRGGRLGPNSFHSSADPSFLPGQNPR